MKIKLNITTLPYLILGFGGIGAALRALMFGVCVDEKGLLTAFNLPQILVAILSLAVAAGVIGSVWKLKGSNRYFDNFPASLPGGLSAVLAAVGIAVTLVAQWNSAADRLAGSWQWLGVAAIPCLIFTGVCRIQGRRPVFLFNGIVCVFFAIHLTNSYRIWSGDPQLEGYLWQLLASVGLLLTSYYHTAFDVGLGSRRMLLGSSLLTGYFCLLATVNDASSFFYLTGGLWALGSLCNPNPRPRRRRPDFGEPPQEVTEEA